MLSRTITIETPEGTLTGKAGDYLITDVNGEQYPCKADVFEQTYERVKDREDVKFGLWRALAKIKRKTKEVLTIKA